MPVFIPDHKHKQHTCNNFQTVIFCERHGDRTDSTEGCERETGERAHYAALTSEVRDRKEAGRHSTKMFSKQTAHNEIYCFHQK